jgi:hypothetical protein
VGVLLILFLLFCRKVASDLLTAPAAPQQPQQWHEIPAPVATGATTVGLPPVVSTGAKDIEPASLPVVSTGSADTELKMKEMAVDQQYMQYLHDKQTALADLDYAHLSKQHTLLQEDYTSCSADLDTLQTSAVADKKTIDDLDGIKEDLDQAQAGLSSCQDSLGTLQASAAAEAKKYKSIISELRTLCESATADGEVDKWCHLIINR